MEKYNFPSFFFEEFGILETLGLNQRSRKYIVSNYSCTFLENCVTLLSYKKAED